MTLFRDDIRNVAGSGPGESDRAHAQDLEPPAVPPSISPAPHHETPHHETPHHETYVGVQLLRGLAAMLVVVFHAGLMVKERFPAAHDHFVLFSGAGGVDIFFPISGFVMLISSRALLSRDDGWKTFIEHRLIRIVPLYWLATTLKLVILLAIPAVALHSELLPWHTIASYLFIPARNAEGIVFPLVTVGWTLNYEMFFYLVFATVLFWKKPLVPIVSAMLLAAVAIGFLAPPGIAPLTVFGPLILEFGAGLWIAALVRRGVRIGIPAAVLMFVAALLALLCTDFLPSDRIERMRLLLWGVPGMALLFAVVSLEPWIVRYKWAFARLLGDASYSIYLSHGFVLPVFGILVAHSGLHGMTGAAISFVLSIVISAFAGIAVYLCVERPMTRGLKRWRRTRRGLSPPPRERPEGAIASGTTPSGESL
jgi:peptidoglycan/LPS O-acetylase OafA/YrhL